MTEEISTGVSEIRDSIMGLAVIERQKAHDELMGRMVELPSVDECLLEDSTVVFQCAHPQRQCNFYGPIPRSVTAHQRTHSDRTNAKKLAEQIEKEKATRAALEAELEKRRRNQVEGGKKAAETRKRNAAEAAKRQPTIDPRQNVLDLIKEAQEQITLTNLILSKVYDEVREIPVMDPELVELATVLAKLNIKK